MCTNQIWVITKSMKLLIRISLKGGALSAKEIITFKMLSGCCMHFEMREERKLMAFDVISSLAL